MLTGKFLQIRKVFATSSLLAEEFSDTLQYKISRKYAKCPDELESFRTIYHVAELKIDAIYAHYPDKNLAIRKVFTLFIFVFVFVR